MLGIGLAALPQKLLAEVVGFVIETGIVLAIGWHYGGAHVQAKWDVAKAAQVSADAAANAKNRQTEQSLAAAKQEIANVQVAQQAQVANVRAALTADADRVRSQLSAALGGRGTDQDSLAACQQRAAAAGDLLGDGLRVQVDLAGAAESLAADARAMHEFADKVKAATQ